MRAILLACLVVVLVHTSLGVQHTRSSPRLRPAHPKPGVSAFRRCTLRRLSCKKAKHKVFCRLSAFASRVCAHARELSTARRCPLWSTRCAKHGSNKKHPACRRKTRMCGKSSKQKRAAKLRAIRTHIAHWAAHANACRAVMKACQAQPVKKRAKCLAKARRSHCATEFKSRFRAVCTFRSYRCLFSNKHAFAKLACHRFRKYCKGKVSLHSKEPRLHLNRAQRHLKRTLRRRWVGAEHTSSKYALSCAKRKHLCIGRHKSCLGLQKASYACKAYRFTRKLVSCARGNYQCYMKKQCKKSKSPRCRGLRCHKACSKAHRRLLVSRLVQTAKAAQAHKLLHKRLVKARAKAKQSRAKYGAHCKAIKTKCKRFKKKSDRRVACLRRAVSGVHCKLAFFAYRSYKCISARLGCSFGLSRHIRRKKCRTARSKYCSRRALQRAYKRIRAGHAARLAASKHLMKQAKIVKAKLRAVRAAFRKGDKSKAIQLMRLQFLARCARRRYKCFHTQSPKKCKLYKQKCINKKSHRSFDYLKRMYIRATKRYADALSKCRTAKKGCKSKPKPQRKMCRAQIRKLAMPCRWLHRRKRALRCARARLDCRRLTARHGLKKHKKHKKHHNACYLAIKCKQPRRGSKVPKKTRG